MACQHAADDEQATLWNGRAGRAWVEAQELLDQMFQPFEDLLVEAVSAGRGSRVLDVGCGTGSTTLAVARRLGAKGRCVGIDISEPMIAARARARRTRRHAGDASSAPTRRRTRSSPPSFDMIVSRFGVMFFDDPVARLREPAARRAGRRRAPLHRLAESPRRIRS